ncbi:hypothetical protein DPMN_187976 [Dreissena polymorpha]|uniref:Uncharacterized protein n=1 Tax=Dreissena polymorpha TaxID=45954 RepID=A0A9D4I817_DREPO|nr:hypothetical protein DPMN_187976 [Dreissena polymorpha]
MMENVELEAGWVKDKVAGSKPSVFGTNSLVGGAGLFARVDAVVAGTGEFLYVMPVVRRVMLQSEFDQDETRVMLQQMPDSFSCLAPNVLKE